MESYLFARWCCHQLSNRVEDNFELFIVLAFQLVQPTRKFGVRREHLWHITNARMISMLTITARLLLNTLESMATPCSVKA